MKFKLSIFLSLFFKYYNEEISRTNIILNPELNELNWSNARITLACNQRRVGKITINLIKNHHKLLPQNRGLKHIHVTQSYQDTLLEDKHVI